MFEGSKTVTTAADLLAISQEIPVVVIKDVEQAVPLAQALVRGGVAYLSAVAGQLPQLWFCPADAAIIPFA